MFCCQPQAPGVQEAGLPPWHLSWISIATVLGQGLILPPLVERSDIIPSFLLCLVYGGALYSRGKLSFPPQSGKEHSQGGCGWCNCLLCVEERDSFQVVFWLTRVSWDVKMCLVVWVLRNTWWGTITCCVSLWHLHWETSVGLLVAAGEVCTNSCLPPLARWLHGFCWKSFLSSSNAFLKILLLKKENKSKRERDLSPEL